MATFAVVRAAEPDSFFVTLSSLVDGMIQLCGFAALARADETIDARLKLARRKLAQLLKDPLDDAKSAETLRRDISIDDVSSS